MPFAKSVIVRSGSDEATLPAQEKIFILLKQNQRIALTCFEADINQCHHKHLAEAITQLPGFDCELKHI